MNKKIKKYPDGGTLPTYTTGTPEYEAYLAKKKQYDAFVEREKTYSGYGNYTVADKATFGSIQPMIANPNTTATGYRVYNTTTAPTKVASDEHYDPNTGRYSVPYYDNPGEATIVKSQAEIDAEKKAAEETEWKKLYQGYVVEDVPIQNEDGTWSKTQEAKPFPVNQTPPTSGTFHTDLPAGAVVKYAGGGKFLQTLGDTAKFTGDTLLSTIGLTDVINDDMYRNQKFADASKIGETVGGYAGKIAGNIIAPGIGGAVVGQAQNFLGQVDGEDEKRAYTDKISSLQSQGELGKFNNSSYSTPDYVNPLNATLTGIGEVGTMISGQGIEGMQNQFGNISNTMSNLPIFCGGGKMKYPDGGILDHSKDILNQPIINRTPNTISGGPQDLSLFDSIKYANLMNQNNKAISNITGTDYNRIGMLDYRKQNYNTPQFADGGEFIEYNGPDHSNGGIDIDRNGQPTTPQNAQANVEGGETMHDDGIDKYIFSDRLVSDPKTKQTFADKSKKINNKYKDPKDKFQKEARELELNRLKQEQEMFKSTIAGTQNSQQQTPMFPDGGVVGSSGLQLMPEDKNLGYDFELNPNFNNNPQINPLNYNPNIGLTIEGQAKDYYLKNGSFPTKISGAVQNELYKKFPDGGSLKRMYEDPNLGNDFTLDNNLPFPWIGSQADYYNLNPIQDSNKIYIDPADEIAAPNEEYNLQTEDSIFQQLKRQNQNTPVNNESVNGLPQDKINPLGFAASNMGNVYDLFQAARPLEKNKFDKVSLDTISLESQRRELEKQAGLARATNRESVRNLATSSGQALGNQIVGNALINSGLSSGLSQSFLSEATTNTGIKNQQEMTNNQIRQSEIIADQMDKAKRQSTTSQALHSVGQNTQGYVRDLKAAEVGNENNKLWFDAIKTGKYTQLGTDVSGNIVIQLHDGRVVTKPKTN